MNLFYIAGSYFVGKETNNALKEDKRGILRRIVGVLLSMILWPIVVLGKVIQKLFRRS